MIVKRNELDDQAAVRIEALEAARERDLWQYASQLDQNTATMDIARARIEALEAALRSIANKCPATCDMTLAHEMAQEAEEALAALERDAGK
jgi:hypothetical protein